MKKNIKKILYVWISIILLISVVSTPIFADWTDDGFGGKVLVENGDFGTNWTEGWTISESHTCNATGYLYGNWSESDHFFTTPGSPDEDWTRANNSHWTVIDHSSWWVGNYTYDTNTSLYNSSFTVLNNSGNNRSQTFGWVHVNDTEVDALYPFIIFSYSGSTDFDCVMWSSTEAWICNWNGTNMTDIVTGDAVVDPSTDATDLSDQWVQEGIYITDSGNYYKIIYNEHNGSLKFKWWGPLFMGEPTGWTIQTVQTNLTHEDATCHGIGVWDPNERDAHVQFDLLNIWQLNYTLNTSDYCNISDYNESRPHMDFPVLDIGTWTEEIMAYFNESEETNLTVDIARDMMKDNITNIMNMESRAFELKTLDNGQQNDTVYYYSICIDNWTGFDAEALFDEWLHLHIQFTPEDDVETGEYADFIVGIDVDNNRQWDLNDRLYYGYANDTEQLAWFQTFNGNGAWAENLASMNIWQTDTSTVGNLHRYTNHLGFSMNIPLADLIKTSGKPINSSDVFGLSIITTTSGDWGSSPQDACVWQNWNETSETPFYTEENNIVNVVSYFLNETEEEGWMVNETCLQRWGEGVIGPGLAASEEIGYTLNVTKTANISSIDEVGVTTAQINYTIWVNNTGAIAITNVVVNDTLFACSCHNFNETALVNTNIDWGNVTNYTCYRVFTNASIGGGESWKIWYVINVSMCPDITHGTLLNTATVNATELGTEYTDTHSISWDSRSTPAGININIDWGEFVGVLIILLTIGFMAGAVAVVRNKRF